MSAVYSLGVRCASEILATGMAIYIAECGVANALLPAAKGQGFGFGFLAVTFGFALYFAGLCFGHISAILNPAVALAQAIAGDLSWGDFFALSASQTLGAFLGACLVWIHYLPHFKTVPEPPSMQNEDQLLRRRDALASDGVLISSYNNTESNVHGDSSGLASVLKDVLYYAVNVNQHTAQRAGTPAPAARPRPVRRGVYVAKPRAGRARINRNAGEGKGTGASTALALAQPNSSMPAGGDIESGVPGGGRLASQLLPGGGRLESQLSPGGGMNAATVLMLNAALQEQNQIAHAYSSQADARRANYAGELPVDRAPSTLARSKPSMIGGLLSALRKPSTAQLTAPQQQPRNGSVMWPRMGSAMWGPSNQPRAGSTIFGPGTSAPQVVMTLAGEGDDAVDFDAELVEDEEAEEEKPQEVSLQQLQQSLQDQEVERRTRALTQALRVASIIPASPFLGASGPSTLRHPSTMAGLRQRHQGLPPAVSGSNFSYSQFGDTASYSTRQYMPSQSAPSSRRATPSSAPSVRMRNQASLNNRLENMQEGEGELSGKEMDDTNSLKNKMKIMQSAIPVAGSAPHAVGVLVADGSGGSGDAGAINAGGDGSDDLGMSTRMQKLLAAMPQSTENADTGYELVESSSSNSLVPAGSGPVPSANQVTFMAMPARPGAVDVTRQGLTVLSTRRSPPVVKSALHVSAATHGAAPQSNTVAAAMLSGSSAGAAADGGLTAANGGAAAIAAPAAHTHQHVTFAAAGGNGDTNNASITPRYDTMDGSGGGNLQISNNTSSSQHVPTLPTLAEHSQSQPNSEQTSASASAFSSHASSPTHTTSPGSGSRGQSALARVQKQQRRVLRMQQRTIRGQVQKREGGVGSDREGIDGAVGGGGADQVARIVAAKQAAKALRALHAKNDPMAEVARALLPQQALQELQRLQDEEEAAAAEMAEGELVEKQEAVANEQQAMLEAQLQAQIEAEKARVTALYHASMLADQAVKLSIFATRPAIHAPAFNAICELLCTILLVTGILLINDRVNTLPLGLVRDLYSTVFAPFAIGLYIVVLILGAGGPTGFAANPARDMGPRLAHFVLPIANKGRSEFLHYGWLVFLADFAGGAASAGIYIAIRSIRR